MMTFQANSFNHVESLPNWEMLAAEQNVSLNQAKQIIDL